MNTLSEKLRKSLFIAKLEFHTQDAITFFKAKDRLLPLQNRNLSHQNI